MTGYTIAADRAQALGAILGSGCRWAAALHGGEGFLVWDKPPVGIMGRHLIGAELDSWERKVWPWQELGGAGARIAEASWLSWLDPRDFKDLPRTLIEAATLIEDGSVLMQSRCRIAEAAWSAEVLLVIERPAAGMAVVR